MKVLLVLCLLGAPAAAEINVAESIEWATADSDVVVRGFVTSYRIIQLDEKWYEVSFQITESVKGGVKQSLRFAVPKSPAIEPARWFEDQSDILLFLVDAKDLADQQRDLEHFRYTIRPARGETSSVLELGRQRAYTRTFQMLDAPTATVAAARRARLSSARTSVNVDAPFDSPAMHALYGGSSVWITVPVDAELEQLGLAWLASENLFTRLQGLAVLEHFRSTANIARLQKLSSDRDLVVRKGAQDVLARWHVD